MKILLIGHTGGIGSAIYEYCIKDNIDVILLDRKECDLSKAVNVDYKNIDGMIYSPGINIVEPYQNVSVDNIIDTMKINSIAFVELCQKINFNNGANIIAIGSLYATETKAGRLSYTMSKHSLLGSVKTLAIEMSSRRIKVNMISPGFVLTKLTALNNPPERIKYLEENIPLGITPASEIGRVCRFLLDNESITGQNIIVDGGYSLVGV